MAEPGENLTPLTKRFAELLAANPNGVACVNQAREEMGLRPPKNNRVGQRLSGYLKLKPGFKEYFDYCQEQIARGYPNKELPVYLKQRGHHGDWPNYATPDQLWEAAEEYINERKEKDEPILSSDLCGHLKISLNTLKDYRNREGFTEVVNRIFTACAAFWEKKMAESRDFAQSGNYELNRLGYYEKQYEADRAQAAQIVEVNPVRRPVTPADVDTAIAQLQEQKQKMLAMVEQAKLLGPAFAGTVADATFEAVR